MLAVMSMVVWHQKQNEYNKHSGMLTRMLTSQPGKLTSPNLTNELRENMTLASNKGHPGRNKIIDQVRCSNKDSATEGHNLTEAYG